MFAIVYALAAQQLDRRQRRLAKYARYRNSVKGLLRTRRYNTSPAKKAADRRYGLSHVRGSESYQNHNGRWRGLMRIDPEIRSDTMAAARAHFGK